MERATLIATLNVWRATAGLTKLDVSRRMGVSRQLISAWLTPAGPLQPSCEQVVDFGRACGIGAVEIGKVVMSMLGLHAIPDGAKTHEASVPDQAAA